MALVTVLTPTYNRCDKLVDLFESLKNQTSDNFEWLIVDDGLTNNDKRYKFASPLGSMLRGKMLMKKECGVKAKIRGAIIYGCYKREVSQNIPAALELDSVSDKLLVSLLYPVSIYFNRKWKV